MKNSLLSKGKISASVLGCCLLITSCNPEEYFDVNTLIAGNDAYCARVQDQASCEAMPGCQPAFEDVESDLEAPLYHGCIANPPEPTSDDDGPDPDDGAPGDEGPDADDDSAPAPTIDDVIANGCASIDDQYLYIKHVMETKKNGGSKKTTTKREVKVKVCHQTGNLSAHTIIIACPALKAHKRHHDDYLGACERPDDAVTPAIEAGPEVAPAPAPEEPAPVAS